MPDEPDFKQESVHLQAQTVNEDFSSRVPGVKEDQGVLGWKSKINK